MRQDEFQKRTKQWLSRYKREVLGVEEDGLWRNGQPYPHILPKKEQWLNILPSFRDEFWKWLREQHTQFGVDYIRLHRDFHHLNSSQAVCFNLFFPLMIANPQGLPPLLSVLGMDGVPDQGGHWESTRFEFQPVAAEGTCIDFSLLLKSGTRVNFEVKYSESEFGSAEPDDSHLAKFERVYKSRLAGRFAEPFCRADQFLKHYQIARNIWCLAEDGEDFAVFLFPKANMCLRQAEETIRACAVEPFRARVRIVYLEDLIVGLNATLQPDDTTLRECLEEFRLKYFPELSFGHSEGAS